MEEFLSDLYRGEIRPWEEAGRYLKKMRPLEKLSERLLEELNEGIDEKSQETLQKYIDCRHEICFYLEQDAFAKGVSFTAKFFVSALD